MASLKVNLNPQSIEKVIYVGAKSQENANSLANLDTKHSSLDISKSAAKRFKKTGTGEFKRNKANKRHILTKKSPARKRGLGKSGLVDKTQVGTVKKMLPYA